MLIIKYKLKFRALNLHPEFQKLKVKKPFAIDRTTVWKRGIPKALVLGFLVLSILPWAILPFSFFSFVTCLLLS